MEKLTIKKVTRRFEALWGMTDPELDQAIEDYVEKDENRLPECIDITEKDLFDASLQMEIPGRGTCTVIWSKVYLEEGDIIDKFDVKDESGKLLLVDQDWGIMACWLENQK